MNRKSNILRVTAMLHRLTDNEIIFIMTFMEKLFGTDEALHMVLD